MEECVHVCLFLNHANYSLTKRIEHKFDGLSINLTYRLFKILALPEDPMAATLKLCKHNATCKTLNFWFRDTLSHTFG